MKQYRIPGDVIAVMQRLYDRGFNVWLVGGAVRDLLRGEDPKDWDLATSGSPSQIVDLFKVVIPIGIRHGTVMIRTSHRGIETTSFSPNGMEGILADLGRRDFSVNAMAISFPEGILLDPHRGANDLGSLVLRGVGDAGQRFREDPLRTLRAGRFVSTYGFTLEQKTLEALTAESPGLSKIAPERIREELLKLILGENVVEASMLMGLSGVLHEILPEFFPEDVHKQGTFDIHVKRTRRAAMMMHFAPRHAAVRLAALFTGAALPLENLTPGCPTKVDKSATACGQSLASDALKRLRMSNVFSQEVLFLLSHQVPAGTPQWSDAQVRAFISYVGVGRLQNVLDLARAWKMATSDIEETETINRLLSRIAVQLQGNHPFGVNDLPVDGRDVMETLGIGPGPRIGGILEDLLKRVHQDPGMNDRNILMDFLRKKVHKG